MPLFTGESEKDSSRKLSCADKGGRVTHILLCPYVFWYTIRSLTDLDSEGGLNIDGRTAVRLGGIFGLLAVIVMIPAYLVGSPDLPGSPEDASGYFEAGIGTFVFSNGVLPLFHVFFFILFLGVLYGVLRSAGDDAQGEGGGLPAAALAGGIVFVGLEAVGFAAEILYPAALQRFGVFEPDAAFVLVSLTLSTWLYHFCQVGASAMVLVTSVVALETGVLPRWLALAGLVVALLTLLHFLVPLLAALVGLLWIAVVSVLMLTGGAGSIGGPRGRTVQR